MLSRFFLAATIAAVMVGLLGLILASLSIATSMPGWLWALAYAVALPFAWAGTER